MKHDINVRWFEGYFPWEDSPEIYELLENRLHGDILVSCFFSEEVPDVGVAIVEYSDTRKSINKIFLEESIDLLENFRENRCIIDFFLGDASEIRAEGCELRIDNRLHEGMEFIDDCLFFEINHNNREFDNFLDFQAFLFIAGTLEIDHEEILEL